MITRGEDATYTLTPNTGYKNVIQSDTCGGTYSGNAYTISNVTENKNCTITFAPETYTLTLDVNGGNALSTNTKTITYNSTYGELPTPTRTGYTFNGWYYGSTKITSSTKVTLTSNHTLKASWTANTYTFKLTKVTGISTIYYKINGASSYTSSTSNVSTTATYGTTYSYYAVASTGYTISSCTQSSPCSGTIGTSGVNATLSATLNTYNVTLSVSNGSGSTTKSVSHGSSVSFTVSPSSGYKAELDTNSCGGTLSGSTYTVSNITSTKTCNISFKKEIPTLYAKLLDDKTERSVTTRPGGFSSVYTSDNTKTLYTSTENGTTVYYFAGNATDNWVKFGKYEKDFIVYRGYYSSGDNYNFRDYQTLNACESASSYNAKCTLYKYASAGDDIYWRIIRTNEDGGIRLLYHSTGPTSVGAYISVSAFNSTYKDSMYVGYMYGTSGSLESNRTNTNNSTIKTAIDTWYASNLTNYTKYLSTTAIYCNDRQTADGTYFGAYTRLQTNKTPTYDCTNTSDAFSVSNSSAKLTYPIGLMTADELMYAGEVHYSGAHAYYYKNSVGDSSTNKYNWWTMTPLYMESKIASMFYAFGSSGFNELDNPFWAYLAEAVRPVTSLKSCVKWASGDGTPDNPYTIDESYSC